MSGPVQKMSHNEESSEQISEDEDIKNLFSKLDKLGSKLNLNKKMKSINSEMQGFRENIHLKKKTLMKSCSQFSLPLITDNKTVTFSNTLKKKKKRKNVIV